MRNAKSMNGDRSLQWGVKNEKRVLIKRCVLKINILRLFRNHHHLPDAATFDCHSGPFPSALKESAAVIK